MTKITIGVSKRYKNAGIRNHRPNTKKAWIHYFLENNGFDKILRFGSEWISFSKAMRLKLKIHRVRKFYCLECGLYFTGVIRKESDSAECPNCT